MNSYSPYINLIKPTKKRHRYIYITWQTQKKAKEIPDYKMRKTRTQIMKHALIRSITDHIVIIQRERERDKYILTTWLRVKKFSFCCVQENKENGKVIHPEMLIFFTLSFCFVLVQKIKRKGKREGYNKIERGYAKTKGGSLLTGIYASLSICCLCHPLLLSVCLCWGRRGCGFLRVDSNWLCVSITCRGGKCHPVRFLSVSVWDGSLRRGWSMALLHTDCLRVLQFTLWELICYPTAVFG